VCAHFHIAVASPRHAGGLLGLGACTRDSALSSRLDFSLCQRRRCSGDGVLGVVPVTPVVVDVDGCLAYELYCPFLGLGAAGQLPLGAAPVFAAAARFLF